MSNNPNQGASIADDEEFAIALRAFESTPFQSRVPLIESIMTWHRAQLAARRTPADAVGAGEPSTLDRLRERNPEFVAHLERNAAEVATWPSWKTGLWASDTPAGAGELPPLPRNYGRFNINGPDEHRIRGWTQEQMHDYARAAIAAADRAQRKESPND
jgi:hypothetical protein